MKIRDLIYNRIQNWKKKTFHYLVLSAALSRIFSRIDQMWDAVTLMNIAVDAWHSRSLENVESVRHDVYPVPINHWRDALYSSKFTNHPCNASWKKDLHYHPYKIVIVQHLNPADYEKRDQFAQSFLEISVEETKIGVLIMSDEPHFHIIMVSLLNKISEIGQLRINKWCKKNDYISTE